MPRAGRFTHYTVSRALFSTGVRTSNRPDRSDYDYILITNFCALIIIYS